MTFGLGKLAQHFMVQVMKTIQFGLLTVILFSCTPTTRITGSWKNPESANKTYATIFVAAMSGNTVAKSTLENDMAEALSKRGVTVTKSIEEFPPTLFKDSITKQVLLDNVKKKKTGAILTITLLKKTIESRYVRGAYTYAPITRFGYYSNFGGYYAYSYPYAYDPGYYTQDEIYFLETNLYDSASERLVWSAQSETYSYDGLSSFSKEFAYMIVDKLKRDGILKVN
jgi:hypothetical protein